MTAAAAVAGEAPVVIRMLPDAPHVEAAVLGPGGAVEATTPGGTTVIDMSTIAPSAGRHLAERLAARGVKSLPVLAAMGKKIVPMGGHGMGRLTKPSNNLRGVRDSGRPPAPGVQRSRASERRAGAPVCA